jgi:hypothetical protein
MFDKGGFWLIDVLFRAATGNCRHGYRTLNNDIDKKELL